MISKEIKDFFAGILAIVFSFVFFLSSLNIRSMGFSQISASFFPKVVAVFLCFLGFILVVRNIKDFILWLKGITLSKKKKSSSTMSFFFRHKVVLTMLFFSVYCFLIDILGFLSASILYLIFQILLFGNAFTKRNFLISFSIAVLFSGIVYVTFQFGFKISLPNGILI